jgi:ribonuclease inhibitor
MKAILEGSKVRTEAELHDAFTVALDLPEYYGRNLDAMWDCLTGWIEVPLVLVWKDYDVCRRHVGRYAERVLDLLRQAETEIEGFKVVVNDGPDPTVP